MDFPLFHADLIGNRAIIAVVATLHVLINHGLAVGMVPLVATIEWHGQRTGDKRWDDLAYKIMLVSFIITTTIGALTGVGIWLCASLINPYAIGSLIRVFFWAWFTEWLVFISEVSLIVVYFLTWRKWMTPALKRRHIRFGFAVGGFSWVTMAIIVAILAFMMDPGSWLTERTLFSGVTNPIYLPQLAFRTPLALSMAGIVAAFLTACFTRRDRAFQQEALRAVNLWPLFWVPLTLAGGWWYASVIPEAMQANVGTALLTMEFEQWQTQLLEGVVATALILYLISQLGVLRPRWVPRIAYFAALLAVIGLTGQFERVREFIRKPFVIGQYMYANGIRVGDYPLLKRDGLLRHSTYVYPLTENELSGVLPDRLDRLADGKTVFMVACSRCHTSNGVNSVVARFEAMFEGTWEPKLLADYITNMHDVRPYMPPFPGNDAELLALSDYLIQLRTTRQPVEGAQEVGVAINPRAVDAARSAQALLSERGQR